MNNSTLKILTTVILYGVSVYLAYFCNEPPPLLLAFTMTTAHTLFFYGVWVEGWLDKKK